MPPSEGSVIYCGTPTDDIRQINSWFNKDITDVFLYKGTYHIENNFKIFIKIPVSIGHLIIDGCIQNSSLILRSSNKEINLYEHWDEYKQAGFVFEKSL
jgi:hypothetical protein